MIGSVVCPAHFYKNTMRKLLFVSMLLLVALPAAADEGMWLLPLLEKMNIKTMQQMGCQLSADDIYSINRSSIKDAVVHIPGCTAELISDEGLLVTNHHCGYSHIQRLSSVEHDYLTDGYWAMNRSEELPAKGFTAAFLESFTDVTKIVSKAVKGAANANERDSLFEACEASLVGKAINGDKFKTAYISELYGGNAYYLVVEKVYKDVRFVGAPPSSIGKFGADTDNWMWPRHTCDFSMFRIYADKDNNPADYSPDNVPMHPKRHLTISLNGVKEGDFTMIIGYPGRTNRFMTASEVREQRDIKNAISIDLRGKRQEILMEDMLADPKVKLQYASKYSGSSNGWKKYIGMNETFGKLDVEKRRAEQEQEFERWMSGNSKRIAKYGKALSLIDDAVASRAQALSLYLYLSESISRIEIISPASIAVRMKDGKGLKSRFEAFYKDYSPALDRKVAREMLKLYRDNTPKENQCSVIRTLEETYSGNIDDYVDNLFETSNFASLEKACRLFGLAEGSEKPDAGQIKEMLDSDPAVILYRSLTDVMTGLRYKMNEKNEQYYEGKKLYIAGQLEMMGKGAAIYPDANSTMRLTYGLVKPYSPKDAVEYDYYTTLKGVMEKEDPDNWEFVVPSRLKELYQKGDFGRYATADGKMPACFINSGDITGGNSGSPVLNAKGELIGLAFDGNWEAMSGDIIFEPEFQRCINVDIRYVLFIVDKFGGAGYLLDEMTIAE